jgi:hypothetical protein
MRIVLKTRQIRSCFTRSRATCPFRDCLGVVPEGTDLEYFTLMPVYLLESATVSVLACLDVLSLKQALFYRDKALLPRIRNIHGARLNRVFG